MTSNVNGPALEIRPGVLRPDWSVATSEAARQALAGRVAGRAGLLEHWSKPLHPRADLVWQTLCGCSSAKERHFTGPFFLVMALLLIAHVVGIFSLGGHGRPILCAAIVLGTAGLGL
jgi:hypothetical protein